MLSYYLKAGQKVVLGTKYYYSNVSGTISVTVAKASNQSTLKLPAQTERIESQAFRGVVAVVIEIPASCTYVASDAFFGCTNLKFIVNHSSVTITPPNGVTVISD